MLLERVRGVAGRCVSWRGVAGVIAAADVSRSTNCDEVVRGAGRGGLDSNGRTCPSPRPVPPGNTVNKTASQIPHEADEMVVLTR